MLKSLPLQGRQDLVKKYFISTRLLEMRLLELSQAPSQLNMARCLDRSHISGGCKCLLKLKQGTRKRGDDIAPLSERTCAEALEHASSMKSELISSERLRPSNLP